MTSGKARRERQGRPSNRPAVQQRATWVKKSHTKRNVAILVFVTVIIGVGVYSLAQSASGSSAHTLQISNSAWKTATLTDPVTGRNFNLTQFSGKIIVLQFMATYCQFCLAEGHQLVTVQQNLAGSSQPSNGVVIISVDVDPNENLAQLKQYVQTTGFGATGSNPPWLYAKDTTGQLLQSIAGNVDFGSFISLTNMYFIDRQQTNTFTTMQRTLAQDANPASDIIAVVNKLL